MLGLYQLGMVLAAKLASFFARFNPKLQRQTDGRRGLIQKIREHYASIDNSREKIIIHVASFGELEQAKPIIARLKTLRPGSHIHLTFFSASGYDNTIGKYTVPDLITYLPFDTKKNVVCFLEATQPDMVIFIRYDVWHILVDELYKRAIHIFLFCATFNNKNLAYPIIRTLYRNTYNKLTAIATIRESDKEAMIAFGIDLKNITVAGDTRFDQVIERRKLTESKNEDVLPIEIQHKYIIIAGSTWKADEIILKQAYIENAILILVPHEINREHIEFLHSLFPNSIDYSKIESYQNESVIIVDSIGKLFSLYRFANVAYIGGGFTAGVHNILEAAVWRIPIICGPNIQRSREIEELVAKGGAYVIRSATELDQRLAEIKENSADSIHAGTVARSYVQDHAGAIDRIISIIKALPYDAS